jgi:hypothetical protein
MTDDRKRRTDAWDSSLTEEQQARIYDRLKSFPWYAVAEWIKSEFAIDPPSKSALYRFREWFADHEAEYLLTQRIKDRDRLERELADAGAPDPQALARAFGNDVIAARARGDDQAIERAVRLYTRVAQVSGDTADMDIKLRKLKMLEEKFDEARQAIENARNKTIDPEQLAAEVDRILGRKS